MSYIQQQACKSALKQEQHSASRPQHIITIITTITTTLDHWDESNKCEFIVNQ